MMLKKLKMNLPPLGLHSKKKGLCMTWKRNIWKNSWKDIRKELPTLKISVGN